MISNRSEFLAAIRVAQPGPDGIRIGPVSYAGENKDILFAGVVDAAAKTKLIDLVKRAATKYFVVGVQWEMPHVRQERNKETPVVKKGGRSTGDAGKPRKR